MKAGRRTKPTVWIRRLITDTSAPKGFNTGTARDEIRAVASAIEKNEEGEPLPADVFPEEMYAMYMDRREKKQPDIFRSGGLLAVSAACADVLRQFDLGQGDLYPLKLFQHDRVTPVEGEYFCLNLGARKPAVLPEQCRRIKSHTKTKISGSHRSFC